jgi:hypothetical protein
MQFNLVICGLDSVEARRWINATLVNMVDQSVPESMKPLIDGGTEGMRQHKGSRRWFQISFPHRIQGSGSRHHPNCHILLRMLSGHA